MVRTSQAVCKPYSSTVWPKAIVLLLLVRSHTLFHHLIIIKELFITLIGNQNGGDGFFSFEYGLQVFDLCADQICRLMEKPNMNKGKSLLCIYHYIEGCMPVLVSVYLQCHNL